MNNNNIFNSFQSGFRARHSTVTANVMVSNDLLLTANRGDGAFVFERCVQNLRSLLSPAPSPGFCVKGTALQLLL